MVEACGAERFLELVDAACNLDPNAPKRIAFIPAGGRGTSFLGRFEHALRAALDTYTTNDDTIKIVDLVQRIENYLAKVHISWEWVPSGWNDTDLWLIRRGYPLVQELRERYAGFAARDATVTG